MNGRFRTLSYILVSHGYNVWDARIEARRILGIKVPYEHRMRGRKIHQGGGAKHMYSPEKYPTDYELAETNFHAIVATCRSVIHGTAVFRSFAEFSSTWHDESERKRNAGKYKIPKESRPDATKALIDRMIHVLKASGMQSKDARKKAKELILDKKEETPNVTIQDTLTEGSSSIRQAEQPETADDRLGHHL